MSAAALVVFLAVVAASKADSEPDLTIVTSELGTDDVAFTTSAQSDFSRRIGKQFPVAENTVNTRGSGGGRQKATNLVSGRKSNKKHMGIGRKVARKGRGTFLQGNCLGLRERTILWWWVRVTRARRRERPRSAAFGRCSCTMERSRARPRKTPFCPGESKLPRRVQLRAQPFPLGLEMTSPSCLPPLLHSPIGEGTRSRLASRVRKRDFSVQSSFSSLHDNRLCGGGGGGGGRTPTRTRTTRRRQMQSHRGNFACKVQGLAPRKKGKKEGNGVIMAFPVSLFAFD